MNNRPLIKCGLIALLLIPFVILINGYSPPPEKAPNGYNSTIIAFEMASNEAELKAVLSPLNEEEINNLDKLNYVDFGFMLTYGILLWMFMNLLSKELNLSYLHKFKWLAVIIVLADAMENMELLNLSHYMLDKVETVTTSLTYLGIFTWLKWLSLSLVFAVIGYTLFKLSNLSKAIGAILMIPIILGLLAFFTKLPSYEDLFASSIFIAFFLITLYSFFYKNQISAKS